MRQAEDLLEVTSREKHTSSPFASQRLLCHFCYGADPQFHCQSFSRVRNEVKLDVSGGRAAPTGHICMSHLISTKDCVWVHEKRRGRVFVPPKLTSRLILVAGTFRSLARSLN